MTLEDAQEFLNIQALEVESPIDAYELEAERFYKATGLMAPGKSAPPGFYTLADDTRRSATWLAWLQSRVALRTVAIRVVLAALRT